MKEKERQTGVQPPWNGNNSSISNILTLWKPLFVFLRRFSDSKLVAAAVVMGADFVYHTCVACGDTGGNEDQTANPFNSRTPMEVLLTDSQIRKI